VLEIGAGPDGSPNAPSPRAASWSRHLRRAARAHRLYGSEYGFANSVEAYETLDICDLTALSNASFDVVVAYGGPLSYVFERQDDAVGSCRRVLKPGGVLLASVMSLWGTLHRHLAALKDLPLWSTKNIVETGDLTPENDPTSPHKCHLFRSPSWRISWSVMDSRRGAGGVDALSTNLEPLLFELRQQPDRWQALLDLEAQATAQPGYVDGEQSDRSGAIGPLVHERARL